MSDQNSSNGVASRRQLLKLGALAAPAVITLTSAPALAQAASSIGLCEVPMPQQGAKDACKITEGSGFNRKTYKYYAGSVDGAGYVCGQDDEFNPRTHGGYSLQYQGQVVNGNQIINQFAPNRNNGGAEQAYYNYVKKLQQGEYGYSCFTSLNNQGLLP